MSILRKFCNHSLLFSLILSTKLNSFFDLPFLFSSKETLNFTVLDKIGSKYSAWIAVIKGPGMLYYRVSHIEV